MLSVVMLCRYAECHYAECCYAECRYAECRYAKFRYAECGGTFLWAFHLANIQLKYQQQRHATVISQ
jgi:hypothetical protein